jgi:phenylacetate-CoA ligase
MSRYFNQADPAQILADYPLGEAFASGIAKASRDELRALQERRFLALMERGWENPFYRRRWTAVGMEAGDIRRLEDLSKVPSFSKSDLMESVEAHPPFGDFIGPDGWTGGDRIIMHTTSGTTGAPQPIFYGPRDREIQNALLARAYHLQGMRSDDVVHSVYGFGMVNGGHYIREAVLHYTDALLLPAGTGLETRSEQQVELMRRFGATVIVGFADYILKLAEVARAAGLEPGKDLKIRMISGHLAEDGGAAMREAWGGAETYDWYGVGDTGIIAAEGPDRSGLYIWEDAHLVEILDTETGQPVADGERGNICDTVLFKNSVYPVIRFDTKDVSTILPGEGGLGFTLKRLAGFQGRSDNMVKLRGINVYPTGIATILGEIPELGGEYVCQVDKIDGRDAMTVICETSMPKDEGLRERVVTLLRQRLGVGVDVELMERGGTAEITQVEKRQKPIRMVDRR